jgi:hypothetical protein
LTNSYNLLSSDSIHPTARSTTLTPVQMTADGVLGRLVMYLLEDVCDWCVLLPEYHA